MHKLPAITARIVEHRAFQTGVIAIILLNAVVIGLGTSVLLNSRYSALFEIINEVILGLFIIEALMKMVALYPRVQDYFKDGWNCFDFAIIVASLLPASREISTVARVLRVLRVLRLISVLPQLRMLVSALVGSMSGMLNILILLSIVFYVYAVAGYHLFHDIDPTHWRTLGISVLSLFRIATLEDWTDIMYAALEHHWWAWAYFCSFVIVCTFVVINLFIGIVITNVEEAREKQKREELMPINDADLLLELRRTQDLLERVQQQVKVA